MSGVSIWLAADLPVDDGFDTDFGGKAAIGPDALLSQPLAVVVYLC